jgi:hypothetical protein
MPIRTEVSVSGKYWVVCLFCLLLHLKQKIFQDVKTILSGLSNTASYYHKHVNLCLTYCKKHWFKIVVKSIDNVLFKWFFKYHINLVLKCCLKHIYIIYSEAEIGCNWMCIHISAIITLCWRHYGFIDIFPP